MTNNKKYFYITTPIYYASGTLHIGHAYSNCIADSIARYERMTGKEVRFLTGSDEHGQKIEEKAKALNETPQQFVDDTVKGFKETWKLLDITYDDFIRTTDERHVKVVKKVFTQLLNQEYNSSVDVGKCLMFGGTQFPIVGICDNAKFSSLHSKTEPVMIVLSKDFNCDNLTVRVKKGANMFDAASKIRTELTKFNAEYPFEMQFYNKILDDTYKNEMRLTNQISVFSLLAIAISIMGVFGLVVFDSEYRRREIAVRKVFGSSTADVVAMFNLKYLKILAVSFIPAVPLSYWFVNRWLEEFAYRISIGWMVYAATFIALAALTAATVTYQCWRTARANPVNSLHAE